MSAESAKSKLQAFPGLVLNKIPGPPALNLIGGEYPGIIERGHGHSDLILRPLRIGAVVQYFCDESQRQRSGEGH